MTDVNLRRLDLNLLNLFEVICETGSVTAAADRVGMSQSAASHALARMREQIGDELFVRSGRALVPTPIGARLYPEIRGALDRLRKAIGEAQGFDPARSARRFTIAIPHIMGPFIALRLRARAAAAGAGLTLHFDTHTRPVDLAGDLAEGLIDLAIDWMPITRPSFVNRVLFTDRLVGIARAGHARIRAGATIDQVLTEETVRVQHRRPTDELPPAMDQLRRYPWQVAITVSEALEVPAIVASTDLIGAIFGSAAQLIAPALGLVEIHLPDDVGKVAVQAIWHESRRADAGHLWLRELVAAELSGHIG
jgi:DNA-binding transcriptional LysR family regulator